MLRDASLIALNILQGSHPFHPQLHHIFGLVTQMMLKQENGAKQDAK